MSAPNDYARLVNKSESGEQDQAMSLALLQPTPAARLAVFHNASLFPKHRIDRNLVNTLDYCYTNRDESLLREVRWRPHHLASLIAETMVEDLERQGKEGYEAPWWAASQA